MNNLNPTWKPVVLSMQRLCNGDPYRPLQIECLDWDRDGSHDLIGVVSTTLDDLTKRAQSGERLALVNAAKRTKVGPSYVNSGLLRSMSVVVTPQPSFLDYISGGCELNFMVSGLGSRVGCVHWSGRRGCRLVVSCVQLCGNARERGVEHVWLRSVVVWQS